ncbi:hypothetical protein [Turicibacter sp. TJ11]|uniref:hypothetical protein n=1 Tax=Turicibacter sp. TJ11 TaxID=2806443 RepID=UPI001F3BF18D|nr:hypothetical protein [Turicibacter sp. TJ11]
MSYLSILEEVEKRHLSVAKAIKEIEKESKRQQKQQVKKLKLYFMDGKRKRSLPGVSFGFVKHFFKLCASFIQLDVEEGQAQYSKEELDTILMHLEEVLQMMKEYPPLEVISIQAKDKKIQIMTR